MAVTGDGRNLPTFLLCFASFFDFCVSRFHFWDGRIDI